MKFGQAICAFANDIMNTGKPGYLFIGADNEGNPSGGTRHTEWTVQED